MIAKFFAEAPGNLRQFWRDANNLAPADQSGLVLCGVAATLVICILVTLYGTAIVQW